MAKPHYLFSLSICLVVLFHGSLARQQLQPQNQCQLRNLQALEPDNRIESEAGSTESWNPNNEQFICAGVAVVRRIIEPKGLLLPQYSNAPQLVYIERGRGITGALFPGCAETFQESQEQGGSSRVRDLHQKLRPFRQGDILALPAGVAHWCYNDGNEPVVAVYVLDTSNSNNQLDMSPRHFYLAGNVEEEFGQQFERGSEGGSREPYSTSRRKGQQGSCNNLFCGMDSRLVAEVFNIDLSLARKLQSESDFRGSIVRVEGVELGTVRPARTEQEIMEQVGPCRDVGGRCPVDGAGGNCNGRAGGHCNGIEETLCTMRMRENIADPSRADVFVPEVGRMSTVNSHNLPILRWLRLSASYVLLRKDAVRLPHWHLNAHSVVYGVRGQGRIQVVNEYGYSVFDGNFREGQVLVVPQNFVVVKRSYCDRFEYVAFKTNDNAMTNDLAGRTSAVRAMPVEVIANAFQVSVEDAGRIKFSREETTFAVSRYQSGSGSRAEA